MNTGNDIDALEDFINNPNFSKNYELKIIKSTWGMGFVKVEKYRSGCLPFLDPLIYYNREETKQILNKMHLYVSTASNEKAKNKTEALAQKLMSQFKSKGMDSEKIATRTSDLLDITLKKLNNSLNEELKQPQEQIILTNIETKQEIVIKLRSDPDMDLIEKHTPMLTKRVASSKIILEQAENLDLPFKIRIKYMGDPVLEGLSGSYFVDVAPNFNPDKPLELINALKNNTAVLKKGFIIKPTGQGIGTKGNPKGQVNKRPNSVVVNITSGEEMIDSKDDHEEQIDIVISKEKIDAKDKEGIEDPSTSGIREVMAYLVQRNLGIDFGVPPTGMGKFKQFIFGTDSEVVPLFTKLFRFPMTYQLFYKFVGGEQLSVDTFKKNLQSHIEQQIDSYGCLTAFQEYFTKIDKEKPKTLPPLTGTLGGFNLATNGAVSDLCLTLFNAKYSQDFEAGIGKIWNEITTKRDTSEGQLCSFQQLVSDCIGLREIKSKKGMQICPKEFEKFALDILIMNDDRHLGNALVHEVSITDLTNNLHQTGINKEKLKAAIQKMKSAVGINPKLEDHLKYVEAFINTLPKTMKDKANVERALHNLFYAELNNFSTTYELVLIDHGKCLAIPSEDSLSSITSEWITMSQRNTKLTGSTKEMILNLDIDKTLKQIKEDQEGYVKQFGEECEIKESCYLLMKLNMILLKNIAKLDAPLSIAYEMIKVKKDLEKIYLKSIEGQQIIDWKTLDTKIAETVILRQA